MDSNRLLRGLVRTRLMETFRKVGTLITLLFWNKVNDVCGNGIQLIIELSLSV